jgi:hypothetical protein
VQAPIGLRIIVGLILAGSVILVIPAFSIVSWPFWPDYSSVLLLLFTYLPIPTCLFFMGCSIWNGSRMGRRLALLGLWIYCILTVPSLDGPSSLMRFMIFGAAPLVYLYFPSVIAYFETSGELGTHI